MNGRGFVLLVNRKPSMKSSEASPTDGRVIDQCGKTLAARERLFCFSTTFLEFEKE